MPTLSQSNELSDDIIFEEILTRLPVKSVVRFKSVSKKWYSTLSSSDFATAHFNKSPFCRPCAPIHTVFIERSTEGCFRSYYIFPFDDSNRISGDFENGLVKLDVDFGDDNKRLRVVGSCNGLICLACNSIGKAYFYLWNPANRKLNKYDGFGDVSAPPNYLNSNIACGFGYVSAPLTSPVGSGYMACNIACGFGYVSAVDDYKFVRKISWGGRDGPLHSTVHVFSCRRNKWTELYFDLSAYRIYFNATLVNEKLYWPSYGTSYDRIDTIISFDLGVEEFNIFHYPNSEIDHLGIMGERLCRVVRGGMIDILMPPTILKSMTLPKDLQYGYLYVINDIVGFTWDGKFLASGEFCEELGYNSPSAVLWLFNTDTEPLECSKLMELEGGFSMFKYVPSLTSPFLMAEP